MFLFDVLNNCAVTERRRPRTTRSPDDRHLVPEPARARRLPRAVPALDDGERRHHAARHARPRPVRALRVHRERRQRRALGRPELRRAGAAHAVRQRRVARTSASRTRDDLGDTTSLVGQVGLLPDPRRPGPHLRPDRGPQHARRAARRAPAGPGSARALGSFFDVAANATLVKAVFDDTGDCAPYCGLLVPYVPDLVLRADAASSTTCPGSSTTSPSARPSATASATSGAARCPTADVSDIIFLSDASLGLGWSIFEPAPRRRRTSSTREYKLGEYNYASYFHPERCRRPEPTLAPERSFTAGAPRAVMLSLSATLGGA